MDGFSGYNQIKLAEEDQTKTSFITQWGLSFTKLCPQKASKTLGQHIKEP